MGRHFTSTIVAKTDKKTHIILQWDKRGFSWKMMSILNFTIL